MSKLIGLTMRTSHATNYKESRDAIARDWYPLMNKLAQGHSWLLIPNLGESTSSYLSEIKPDAIIFSGGDSLGDDLQRDTSERQSIEYLIENQLPGFGVCRGLQLFQVYFGGKLRPVQNHVNCHHKIVFNDPKIPPRNVNSFHNYGFTGNEVADSLVVLAQAEDTVVEAVKHSEHQLMAIGWHPERNEELSQDDLLMIKQHLELK